ncbi:MAG: AI-2E family transporter, partial [Actinobacteria bacterium]|nr:AI-2E family transporter [Actinomycetota bacterium]
GDSTHMAEERARPGLIEERRLPPMSHYAKATVTVVLVAAALSAAWSVRNILILVLIAAVLAIGLDRPVRRLERWGISRGWGVALIFLATIAMVTGFSALVVPPLVSEVGRLASDIPGYLDELERSGGWLGEFVREHDLATKLREFTEELPQKASQSFGSILGFTASVASVIFNLLTIAILTIYFLMALPKARRTSVSLMDPEDRLRGGALLSESLEKVGGYVSGNILVSIIAGGVSFVALTIIGVPFAVALAMWVAIADLIPTVGATLGAVAAVAVAAFDGTPELIATAAFFIVYQQVENYVIVPRVMKESVDLSPAAVIVSVLIGGSLAGFAGALLALPVAAVAKVLIKGLWMRDRVLATDEADPAVPPAAAPS